jgi:hypothetical protein
MTVSRPALVVAMASATLGGLWLASYGSSRAQEGPSARPGEPGNVADAMLRPVRLPFGEGKSLEEVAAYLRTGLRANVVLDLAALDRHELKSSDRVRIDLDGVRLKTGLKLLLDQVGLAARVLPEDNLLLITDRAEADEPIERVLQEIKALHRDLHDVQDDIREIRDMLSVPADEEPVARARNPTIIEEMPGEAGKEKPREEKKDRPGRSRPGM